MLRRYNRPFLVLREEVFGNPRTGHYEENCDDYDDDDNNNADDENDDYKDDDNDDNMIML